MVYRRAQRNRWRQRINTNFFGSLNGMETGKSLVLLRIKPLVIERKLRQNMLNGGDASVVD
jgi:hypothetical protein